MSVTKHEKALLIALRTRETPEQAELSMDELAELTATAGGTVIGRIIQHRVSPDPKFSIGMGKVSEIRESFEEGKPDVVIFNTELTPTQARNLETEWACRVITRTELILDIFALHARSKTAKLQVELAQLEYQLPRIVGQGLAMSRLGGGIGTRGPGEKQMEYDKRYIRKRIDVIKEKLKVVEVERETQRHNRQKNSFRVALVGYTNTGKSTLLNRLTRSDVLAENKLFATLDTTSRQLYLGADDLGLPQYAVLTDTVGFIRDLPHGLIESFHSTLEDTLEADLLVHVIDAADPSCDSKMRVVEETLEQIRADRLPRLDCMNKIDNLMPEELLEARLNHPMAIFVSALTGEHCQILRERLQQEYRACITRKAGGPEQASENTPQ